MFLRYALLLALSVSTALGQESALIRVGELWRYYKGTNEPSTGVSAWWDHDFDDSQWSEGISGFSNGFGIEYDEPTRLPDFGTAYSSLYVRKEFVVTNLANARWLTLRVDYDDGMVAYLNGTEVARRNVPGPPGEIVPFNAFALAKHARGQTDEIDLTAAKGFLREGPNLLSIQVHTSGPTDRNFTLLPELLCNFTRGPFVQNASTNRIQIIWKTPYPSDTRVDYGVTSELGTTVQQPAPVLRHVVTLDNLLPDTVYHYRVGGQSGENTVASDVATFRTLKTAGAVRFAVLGDSGSGSHEQYAVAERIRMARPDLVMHVGDVIYPQFITNWADARCLSVYYPHMKTTPYFFAIGNHDLYAGDAAYLDSFYLPTNTVTGTEHFYSFDHGDVHFTVLLQPFASQYLLTTGDFQHGWLTNDLAQTTKPWKLIFMHAPMLSSGIHRFDDYAKFGTDDRIDIMNALLPIASQYGVQMVFAGHDHDYERFNPTNGVHSVVTGGGGGELRWLLELDPASSQFRILPHFLNVTVDGDALRMEAISEHGEVFDWMTLQRTLPAPKVYDSVFRTPPITSELPDDMDGNVNGQRFNFTGVSIPTLPGRLSNLGTVHVSNDRTNLYIGFDQTMIYSDQNVFLFLETPGLHGVTNLVNVGNGYVDPDEQGADGLDFLQNLSFTNFLPSIGVILGDEFGDAQARSFARLSLSLNIGQGAFYLNEELGDVPGARLQQFNRSPQDRGFAGEENANFIEVAIPFSALGNLRPDGVIKLGAVVGLGSYDTNAFSQSRELDTSFLGNGLNFDGEGGARLEGVSIKLAIDADADDDGDGVKNSDEALHGTDMLDADSDGDGLLDGWEISQELDPLDASGDNGGEADLDGDGLSNVREQFLGTNPRDAKSAIRLILNRFPDRRYQFSWSTVAGKLYQLEFTDSLSRGFTNLTDFTSPWEATTTNQVHEMNLPLEDGNGDAFFFRVRLLDEMPSDGE